MRSYMAYTLRDCREYIAESGVYISTAGSELLSQGCIFWQLVVELVYIAGQLRNLQLQPKWKTCFCNGRTIFPHSSLGEPLPTL